MHVLHTIDIKASFYIEPVEIEGVSNLHSLARTMNNAAIPYGMTIPEAQILGNHQKYLQVICE